MMHSFRYAARRTWPLVLAMLYLPVLLAFLVEFYKLAVWASGCAGF